MIGKSGGEPGTAHRYGTQITIDAKQRCRWLKRDGIGKREQCGGMSAATDGQIQHALARLRSETLDRLSHQNRAMRKVERRCCGRFQIIHNSQTQAKQVKQARANHEKPP